MYFVFTSSMVEIGSRDPWCAGVRGGDGGAGGGAEGDRAQPPAQVSKDMFKVFTGFTLNN